jgi:hypothetical protein
VTENLEIFLRTKQGRNETHDETHLKTVTRDPQDTFVQCTDGVAITLLSRQYGTLDQTLMSLFNAPMATSPPLLFFLFLEGRRGTAGLLPRPVA